MNSELIVKLENLLEKYEGELKVYQDEYNELTDLTHVPSKKDLARMKQIRKEVSTLATDIKEMREDVNSLKEIDKTICDLTAVIQKNDGVTTKFAKEMKEQLLEEEKALEEAITNKWSELKPEKEETKEEETTEKKKVQTKPTSKKKLITIAALCAAIGILTGVVIGKSTSKKVKNQDSNIVITEVDNTKEAVNEGEFTDINNEEAVLKRANEVKTYFDTYAKEQNITVDDIANYLRYINGGVVNEVSFESAIDVINEINLVGANEIGYAVDIHNNGQSNRENKKVVVDYSKLFLDNSNGQRLAKKIVDLREKMMTTDGDIKSYQKEFTELLMNSWYLNGYNEIDAYTLETSGMKAMIDTLFFNTASLAIANSDEKYDVVVKNGLTGTDMTLTEIIEQINANNCPVDGSEEKVSKFTSDLYGMVDEAAFNKNNSLTLTK